MKKIVNFKKVDLLKILPNVGKKLSTPGTVSYIGKKRDEDVLVSVIDYNENDYSERVITDLTDLKIFKKSNSVTWINISGVHQEDVINKIGEIFDIHSLTLEDIANTTQRPKIEEHEKYIFMVMKMVYSNKKVNEIVIEQISLILGKGYVITFQENIDDIFDPLRDRIKNKKGKIRTFKSDYLLYAITDSIIDYYFNILEDVGERAEDIEEEIIIDPTQETQRKIYRLKRRLVYIKKPIWPTREIMNNLIKTDNKLISSEVKLYIRDVYDHTIQVIETIESVYDIVSSILDLYLSTISNKMNEVMKILTIFAALFIPLTFIAGIYGMNFEYIPELSWHRGYFGFWGVTIAITIGMLLYFKKKKWM